MATTIRRFIHRLFRVEAEEAEGIVIPDEDRLRLGVSRDLYRLLEAIGDAIPAGAILYIEGTTIAPDVQELLKAKSVVPSAHPTRGTIWPTPVLFHMPLVKDNLDELRRLAEQHAEPEVCNHLVVYDAEGVVLLDAYDAGDDEVHVNRRKLSPERIARFREVLFPNR